MPIAAQILLDEISAAEVSIETGEFFRSSARVRAAVSRGLDLLDAEQITVSDMNAINRSAMNATRTLRRVAFGKRT